jgi:hypothetical protein
MLGEKQVLDLLKVIHVMNLVLLANILFAFLDLGKYFSFSLLLLVAGVAVFITRVVFDNNLTYSQNIYSKPWYKTMAILSFPVFVFMLFYYKEWLFIFISIIFLVSFYYFNRFMKKKDLI